MSDGGKGSGRRPRQISQAEEEENWLRIFNKNKVGGTQSTPDKPLDSSQEQPCSKNPKAPHGFNRSASHDLDRYVCDCEGWIDWDEARIDVIGSNGNDGLHYVVDNAYQQVEKDYNEGN